MDWWGGQGFGDWLWNVAFDGIGSTAIATVVAVYFVLRTLRNDRDLAAEEARRDREAAFEAGCQRLIDGARQMTAGLPNRGIHSSELAPWLADLWHLSLQAPAEDLLLRRVMQAAYEPTMERTRGATGGVGWPEVVNAVQSIESALQKRLALPDYFRDVDAEVGDDAVAQIEAGGKFLFR